MSIFKKVQRNIGQGSKKVEGFKCDAPVVEVYKDAGAYQKALSRQRESIAVLDADDLSLDRIGLNGEVQGTDYRLSKSAFGDLCSFSGVPSAFAKELAKCDGDLAMNVIQTMVRERFHRGQRKQLVIDTGSGLVYGIVGGESYSAMPNADVFDWAMSSQPEGYTFTNGWLEGPHTRFTVVDDVRPVEPKRGDIVKLGIAGENSINGDRSAKVQSYAERLVCTNGMVRRDEGYAEVVRHSGDAEFVLQRALVMCADKAIDYRDMMTYAAERFLNEQEAKALVSVVGDHNFGGSPRLQKEVLARAQSEAQKEGRDPASITLWNMVNGVTECAHAARSIDRRAEIENLGSVVLRAGQRMELAANAVEQE